MTLVRVDSRLIHGQVVEAWIPFLRVKRVVVADDEASANPLMRAAMSMALPSTVHVEIHAVQDAAFSVLAQDNIPTLLLLRDVPATWAAYERGLPLPKLNLGNVHFALGRKQVATSVFLSEDDLQVLQSLAQRGTDIEAQSVPAERPVRFGEILERYGKA
ncbi:MAG: PTS sugar transporter subunit IIB [Myxococcaceae bacterium]